MTFGSISARAYIIDTNNGGSNPLISDVLNGTGTATASSNAQLAQYSAGLGVTSTASGGDGGTGSPEHTMDNQLGYEFIVFKMPDNYKFDNLTVNSFRGSGTSSSDPANWSGSTGDADVTVWVGGDNVTSFDWFNGKNLSSILGAPNSASLSGNNFAQLNLKTTSTCASSEASPNGAGPCSNVTYTLDSPNIETPAPAGSDASGKWIIVAAAMTPGGTNNAYFTDRDDSIKVASISATKDTPPPPGKVSEPGTLAMLVVGAGYALWRRRREGVKETSITD